MIKFRSFLTAAAVLIGAFIITAGDAAAHRPLWGSEVGDITEIPDMTTSFALYRDITAADQVDLYELSPQAGDEIYAGINIPAVEGLESYGVSLALLGPGLPDLDAGAFPTEVPEGMGGVVVESVVTEDFYEPFTQTNYWGRQQIELIAVESGTHFLAVWQPDGTAGKYVIDVGREEVFGPADMFRFPIWWVQVHAYFGHTPQMLAAAAAILLFAAILFRKRVSRLTRLATVGRKRLAEAGAAAG